MANCRVCKRTSTTRLEVCFDCAECESLIDDGTDMYDKPLEQTIPGSPALNVLHHILKRYGLQPVQMRPYAGIE